MTGGIAVEKSVEVVNLTTARPGPPLPWEFSYHCIAKMGSKYKDYVIMIGGHKHPNRTLIGATKSNSGDFWAKPSWLGPKLQDGGRWSHSCTHIKHNNGSNYVIVAGDHWNSLESHSTSEILNTDGCNEYTCSSGWYPGEDFL